MCVFTEDSEDEGSSDSDEGEMAAIQRTLRNEKAKVCVRVPLCVCVCVLSVRPMPH